MRLINADALYNALRELCDVTDCNIAIMPDVATIVREAPTVDAAPVRHAHLEVHKHYASADITCSKCNFLVSSVCVNDIDTTLKSIRSFHKYCPKCGAKMDEEENHD